MGQQRILKLSKMARAINKENALEVPKLGVTYKEFVKNPITAMLFMAISALSYFVYDMKQDLNKKDEQIETMRLEMKVAIEEIKNLREDVGALRAELNTRKELSKFR
jgi:hypothetical protein